MSDEYKWSVYKHTFPNGKVYIGITSRDVKVRKRVGELNPFFGKHHTDETKEKIRVYNSEHPNKSFEGKHHTDETKQYFRELYTGKDSGLKCKAVSQYTKDGIWVQDFDCIGDAARNVGCATTHICACCKGKTKTVRGFVWKYKEIS